MVGVETKGSGFDNDMKVVTVVNADDSRDDSEAKLRALFDQALAVMLNEATSRGCIRPIPVLLADGKALDLFKLFRVVRHRGGIDLVSGFWTFVAKELGLEQSVSASVKLIYFKYLYELERWLSGCCSRQSLGNGELELEARFRMLLSDGYRLRGSCDKHSRSNSNYNGNRMNMDVRRNKVGLSGTELVCRNRHDIDTKKFCSENKKHHNNVDCDSLILDPSTCKKDFISRKRKRESLSEMLHWVSQIAKCPYGSVEQIPPFLKRKDHGGDDLLLLAVRARDSLLQRKWNDSNPKEKSFQRNKKNQPSMYDDDTPPGYQCSERLRCSERISASAKTHPSACCNSNLSHQGKHLITHRTERYNDCKEQKIVLKKSSSSVMHSLSKDESQHILPFVGPRFQAKIPEWAGMVSEGDSKWLGTRVWPITISGDNNASLELDIVGKGRPSSCNCRVPGSVECIRFHTAEKRMKLKREIGNVFYHWKFDRMGEEVSLRWTEVEESRFKDIVLFNPPSLGKCFWDEAPDNFPTKKMEELISYYFNVFVVRRRCYQNRVTPKDINSDDDDLEFGCIADRYGIDAVKVSSTNLMPCSENKEFTEFK